MPTNKYFKCQFCDSRLPRLDLIKHIEKNHLDELPQGFTPLRCAFLAANHKPMEYAPPCRACRKPTPWNETKGRFDILCGDKRCKDAYMRQIKEKIGDKWGAFRPTASAEGLEMMLSHRRISGKYKWSDGTEYTYTGKYELKALKFMDKVMEIKSEDLVTPGPAMEYELDGKKHIYISDMYYIPYNLIIEIKDGGDKPNTNPNWVENRKKTIAKEKHIVTKTNYNYIRLTNNNFSQLLSIFADMKYKLVEDKKDKRTIHINENMLSTIAAAIPMGNPTSPCVIHYKKKNNVFNKSSIGISDSPKFDSIFTMVDGKLKEVDKSYLVDATYETFIVKDFDINTIKEKVGMNIDLYKEIFGHRAYTMDQIYFEENCEPYEDFYYGIEKINKFVKNEIGG